MTFKLNELNLKVLTNSKGKKLKILVKHSYLNEKRNIGTFLFLESFTYWYLSLSRLLEKLESGLSVKLSK